MRNLFVTILLGFLLAAVLSSAAIAEDDQKDKSGQGSETYQLGPFKEREEQDRLNNYGTPPETDQSQDKNQTNQTEQSKQKDPSGNNSQSNDNNQSGESGQSGESK